MATNTTKPVHSLVLDAGPIIKNEPAISTLLSQAEELYTIPAVIEEIRDPITRARFETISKPFIKLRSPTPASVKIMTDFARRTGDLEVLSRPDIHLMALTYELECERNNGNWRLRSVPGQKGLNGKPPGTLVEDTTKAELSSESNTIPTSTTEGSSAEKETEISLDIEAEPIKESKLEMKEVEEKLAESHISPEDAPRIGVSGQENLTSGSRENQTPISPEDIQEVPENEVEDSDEEGWITPQNLKQHQEKDANGLAEPEAEVKIIQVACITSDFAMQNVLLRMNLNLLAPNMQRIRQLKTWVLRCHACFFITRDMGKQFCARCGKPTLLRTSCSTDKDGNFKVHLKKNMQWNTRGNVYSIPKPVAGTSNGKLVAGGGKGGWGQSLILAEDQKEYVQAMTGARRKKEKDLMDEDYLPNILSGDRRSGGRPKVGAGKTINSRKRK
ncbi:Nin one binding Zn-ribbon like-domain-containing protein [Tricladium varicosporioides]|nr:Nin one binding Zn-ribbon like-domain-containing protein [Hymenoscyphus varicosporioides]